MFLHALHGDTSFSPIAIDFAATCRIFIGIQPFIGSRFYFTQFYKKGIKAKFSTIPVACCPLIVRSLSELSKICAMTPATPFLKPSLCVKSNLHPFYPSKHTNQAHRAWL